MSKLKKEELLEILRDIKSFINTERKGWWEAQDEQAYQQIKEMIQNQPSPIREGSTFIDADTEKVWKWDGKNWIEIMGEKKPEMKEIRGGKKERVAEDWIAGEPYWPKTPGSTEK